MIRLGNVNVTDAMVDRVNHVLRSGEIGQSSAIEAFEARVADWLGVKHCIAVSSGTMADTIALAVLKHFNPGKDEVILPALTFIAQVNAVVHNGLKPVFVDVDDTLNMRPADAASKITKKTLCLFPVHLLGRPVDLLSMKQVSQSYGVPFIEDSCEAMGSEYNFALTGWKKCGTFGAMGTFSFFPSHTITTGEGGMIATNDDDYAAMARRLRNHGKTTNLEFHFDVIGFNGKMSSVTAAMGFSAMDGINDSIVGRRAAFFAYGGREDERTELVCPHAFPVIYNTFEERNRALIRLRENGVECRNLFSSIPTQEKAYEHLGYIRGAFPYAEHVGDCGLYVPCHAGIAKEDVERVKGLLHA